ncbi:hypothetical protein LIA77_07258 [Sarocladium implicatum]|nr:hypothetical protein LIA77_07258 [Sarocladium implicatum]
MDAETHVLSFYDGELRPRSAPQSPALCSTNDLITFLTRLSPYPLPLLRKLQLSAINEHATLVTVGLPVQKLRANGKEVVQQARRVAEDPSSIEPSHVWTLALVYRPGHPSTEIWFFSSLEIAHGHAAHEKETQAADVSPDKLVLPFSDATRRQAGLQIATILSHIPITSRQPGVKVSEQCLTFGGPGCLAGNVHTTVAALLAEHGLIVRGSQPYGHYVYPAVAETEGRIPDGSSEGLPDGLIWSTIQPSDHADVMAVNKIVRSAATIAHLPSAAIRKVVPKDDGSPGKAVAFGFASGDGSLRTLHVDPEYRRMGLAKAVVRRLLSTGVFAPPRSGPFSPDEDVYKEMEEPHPLAFTSVEKSNVASIKTFEGVKAVWSWDVYWIWVDLDKASDLVKHS